MNNTPTVTLKNGTEYTPKPEDEVKCLTHGIVTTYGALGPIQLMAFHDGLDSTDECLLDPNKKC